VFAQAAWGCQPAPSRSMALSVVIILRMTRMTLGFLPAAARPASNRSQLMAGGARPLSCGARTCQNSSAMASTLKVTERWPPWHCLNDEQRSRLMRLTNAELDRRTIWTNEEALSAGPVGSADPHSVAIEEADRGDVTGSIVGGVAILLLLTSGAFAGELRNITYAVVPSRLTPSFDVAD
jgi:hypothetical protein